MIFDINEYTYTQNKNKFYVGDINVEENIKFKCDYIVVGSIKTSGMLVVMENLIVIGDIEASSVFINKDLFCTGKIISKSIDVDGKSVILERNTTKKDNELIVEIEESILELIYENLKYYGYRKEAISVRKYKDNKYYINLEIEEKDINFIFLGYINQVLKSICKELNEVKIHVFFDKDIKKLVSRLLNIDIKYLDIEDEDKVIKINNNIDELNPTNIRENKDLIEELCGYAISFSYDISSKEERQNEFSKDICIDNLIQNINEVLSKKNEVLSKKNEVVSNRYTSNKQIKFESSEIYSEKLENRKLDIDEYEFCYVKYNKKIYINSNQIFEILNLEKSYKSSKLMDYIIINYTYNKKNNIVKFYNLDNFYKFIIEISKNYKVLNVEEKILLSLYNTVYNLDLKSENIQNSIPYWSIVIDRLTIHMTEKRLKEELKISNEDFKEIKLGYTPSKNISKTLKNLYLKYCNENNNKSNIEKLIYTEMEKNKYDLNQIKIHEIKYEKDKKYTVYIESKQHNNKTLDIISDKINSSNKEYIIRLRVYEPNNLSNIIDKEKINESDKKVIKKMNIHTLKDKKEFVMGEDVIHDTYGNGIITKLDTKYGTIKFNNCEKKFDINFLINKALVKKLIYLRF